MRRSMVAVLAISLAFTAGSAAQTQIDGVLLKFGGDIITRSDVRQARLLKLVQSEGDSDQAYVNALVDRRLMLAELKRSPPAEPSAEAVDAKRAQWLAALGSGIDVPDLLARAGLTEALLRGWFRDDLRLQTYLSERFAGRASDVAVWIVTLRQRAGLK